MLVITAIVSGVLGVLTIIFLISFFRQVTIESEPRLTENVVRVQVLNGCGTKGLAEKVGEFLRSNRENGIAFDVVEVKNAPIFGFERTLVVSRIRWDEPAKLIAKKLKTEGEILTERLIRNPLEIDVTVVVGSDYKELGI